MTDGEDDQTRTLDLNRAGSPTRRGRKSDGSTPVVVVMHPGSIPNLGRRYPLTGTEHVIGRLAETDIPLETESVSRRHARFFRSPEGWNLEDLGSTNGCYINDQRIDSCVVRDGDIVRIGEAVLKFLAGTNIEAAYHEEIYRLSTLDGLTGVHNKRYLVEFLDRELARARRRMHPLGLVMFDLDHFKNVNDTYGHLAGDHVLKEVCRRLKPRIRREDLLARYGGEEFCCILPETLAAGVLTFAEAIRGIVSGEPIMWEEQRLTVTVSLGIACMDPATPLTAALLIGAADERLYAAKHAGRNRVGS